MTSSAGAGSSNGGPAGQHTVRQHNQQLVLAALVSAPGSRAELSARTGLTKATVSSLVDELLAAEVLAEGDPAVSGPGRPSRPLSFAPGGPVAVGVEINVDYLAGCVLDLAGTTVRLEVRPSANRDRDVDELLADVDGLISSMLGDLDRRVLGVALALPGAVSPSGVVLRAPNLPRLAGVDLAAVVGPALGHWSGDPVLLENEANAAALAWLRATGTDEDFAYVSGEIGVGAGLVVGGALFRGAHGFAGELGHVVVDAAGPSCGCGGSGCVEQYAGQEVVLAAAGADDPAGLLTALAAGSPTARIAVDRAGRALGVGLASLLNTVDVPLVVLGGLYARLFEQIAPVLSDELGRRALSAGPGHSLLIRSELGVEAAVLGAAGMVVERALSEPAMLLSASHLIPS